MQNIQTIAFSLAGIAALVLARYMLHDVLGARDIARRAIMRAQCSSRAEHFARRVK